MTPPPLFFIYPMFCGPPPSRPHICSSESMGGGKGIGDGWVWVRVRMGGNECVGGIYLFGSGGGVGGGGGGWGGGWLGVAGSWPGGRTRQDRGIFFTIASFALA